MAITIVNQKATNTFHPASNPINVTVSSSNSGKCNFRFICDVYINNVRVFRDKLFPDPATGYGFFQEGRIIQDYIENVLPKTPITGINSLLTNDSVATVILKFGEEYDSSFDCSGTVTQYLNLSISNTFFSFNGGIPYQEFPTWDYTKHLGVWGSASNDANFLTNSPRKVDVAFNEPYYLDIYSVDIPTAYTTLLVGSVGMLVSRYFKDGTSTTTMIRSTVTFNSKRFRLACGPYDLNKLYSTSFISDSVSRYEVKLVWNIGGFEDCTLSEVFNFNVIRPRDFQKRFGFVGLLGSIEMFTFYQRNMTGYVIDKSVHRKYLQRNYGGNWSYEVGDRQDTVFNVKAQQTSRVGTFCSRDASEWLTEMWLSPNVFLYDLPKAYKFHSDDNGSTIDIWLESKDGNDYKAGDSFFFIPEYYDGTSWSSSSTFTVTAVDGNKISTDITSDGRAYCGYIYKNIDWKMLPIVVSDRTTEIKEKLTRPIEYNLNYTMAFDKTTVK